jgi:hypothetical protein
VIKCATRDHPQATCVSRETNASSHQGHRIIKAFSSFFSCSCHVRIMYNCMFLIFYSTVLCIKLWLINMTRSWLNYEQTEIICRQMSLMTIHIFCYLWKDDLYWENMSIKCLWSVIFLKGWSETWNQLLFLFGPTLAGNFCHLIYWNGI